MVSGGQFFTVGGRDVDGPESYFPLFDLSGKLFVYDFAGAGLDGFAGDTALFSVKVEHLDIGIGGGLCQARRQAEQERKGEEYRFHGRCVYRVRMLFISSVDILPLATTFPSTTRAGRVITL